MEQRTFLAIVLSFVFLLSYNALVIAPQQRAKKENHSQVIDNKTVTSPLPGASPSSAPISGQNRDLETTGPQTSFENEFFRIDFLTTNGYLKEIFSKTAHYSPILSGFLSISANSVLSGYQDGNPMEFVLKEEGLEVTQELMTQNANVIKAQIIIKNTSNLSILKNVQFTLFNIDLDKLKQDNNRMRDNVLFEYSLFLDNKIVRRGNAFKFSEKDNKTEQKQLEWAGWRDRYHFTIVKPEFKILGYSTSSISSSHLHIAVTPEEFKLEPGETKAFAFTIYMGPQDLGLLRSLDGNINKIMAFSGHGFLDFIEKFIYNVLLTIHKAIPNWGLCIILISLLIYGATYPLTLKSTMSMRKMQQLQPKMAELREKYKSNPQKLNAEVVELYRIHNVNPLSGCLPVLLQMPVFISLYQVLWRTHNFQGARFLWIKDLSEPDRLFLLPSTFPFIGNEINILPVLMMVVMFFQQKISSKNMVVVDPAQEMQQKMMVFMMPIFIGSIFYHFASGLTLYFTVFYLLSTLTQYKMSKIK
jgi:YidC/Oxa1 family membrane protein insertase